MIAKELKNLLKSNDCWNKFVSYVQGEGHGKLPPIFAELGLTIKFVHGDRIPDGDFNGYLWIVKVNDEHYGFTGFYDSYEGTELDRDSFSKFTQKTKKVTYWKAEGSTV